MQNTIQKFWQCSIVFEKPGILSQTLKTLTSSPTILQFNIFCWNFVHVFYLPMPTKGYVGFFLFYLELELIAKIKKDLVSTHSFYNSRSKQNEKIPTHTFVGITK